MTIPLVADLDQNSTPTWAFDLTDTTYGITIAADTNVNLTVPADAYVALFSYSPGQNVLVRKNDAPITGAPGGSFEVKVREQLLPGAIRVEPGDTLSFWSVGDSSLIYVGFYKN